MKTLQSNSGETSGKKSSWIEYDDEVGLVKEIGHKKIVNNNGIVGKVNKRVAKKTRHILI